MRHALLVLKRIVGHGGRLGRLASVVPADPHAAQYRKVVHLLLLAGGLARLGSALALLQLGAPLGQALEVIERLVQRLA